MLLPLHFHHIRTVPYHYAVLYLVDSFQKAYNTFFFINYGQSLLLFMYYHPNDMMQLRQEICTVLNT